MEVVTFRPWSRRRREPPAAGEPRQAKGRAGAGAGEEDETVRLTDEEHAWWAARDSLQTGRVPHGRKRRPDEQKRSSAFASYYTNESLFEWGVGASADFDESDPYVVLGLPPSATWEQITAAHRRLAKEHHPDRHLDASPEERERSDERIRKLNVAYMELRRRKGR